MQPRIEVFQGFAVLSRLVPHAAIAKGRAYDAVEGATTLGGVCRYERPRRQNLFVDLTAIHDMGRYWVGAHGDDIIGFAGYAGMRLAR